MAGGGRRRIDREQVKHKLMLAWSRSIDVDLSRFRLAIAKDRARREHDASALAALDQAGAELRDERRRVRRKLRHLRRRLRKGGPASSGMPK
jgi:hypothetical protein